MVNSLIFPVLTLIVLSAIILLYEVKRLRRSISGFDGPKGLPVFGSVIFGNSAEQFRKWSAKFGHVFQAQLGQMPVLVVNSASAAQAIFSCHSNALASRPELWTFHKVFIVMQALPAES